MRSIVPRDSTGDEFVETPVQAVPTSTGTTSDLIRHRWLEVKIKHMLHGYAYAEYIPVAIAIAKPIVSTIHMETEYIYSACITPSSLIAGTRTKQLPHYSTYPATPFHATCSRNRLSTIQASPLYYTTTALSSCPTSEGQRQDLEAIENRLQSRCYLAKREEDLKLDIRHWILDSVHPAPSSTRQSTLKQASSP